MSTLKKSKRVWISQRPYWRRFTWMEQGRTQQKYAILKKAILLPFSTATPFLAED